MKHPIRLAVLALSWITSCTTSVPTQRPLPLTSPAPTFTCSAQEWHQEWTENNACMACAQDVQTCVRGKGFEFCRQDCNACLGEEICAVPSNLDFAVSSIAAAKHKPGQIRALIRADVTRTPVTWVEVNAAGLVLIGNQIYDKNGALWRINPEKDCRRMGFNEDIIYTRCEGRIELFSAATGFRQSDLKVTFQPDKDTEVDVDPSGKTYRLADNDSARIFDANGKQLAMYEYPDAVTRVGPTWAEHAVLKAGIINYFLDGKRTHSEASQFQKGDSIEVHGPFMSNGYGAQTTIFDSVSRAWFSVPGDVQFRGGTVLRTDPNTGNIWELFPTKREWKIAQRIAPDADPNSRFLSNSDIGMYRVIDDELFATVFSPGRLMGSYSSVFPALQANGVEFTTQAARHGDITWWASVEEDDDAIWVASADGLVKRWSFKTGKGVRADIPFEFAIGGGHPTSDGGLVLMSRLWNPVEAAFTPGQRVMIWHPERDAQIVNLPDTDILDAALIDKNTLVVVGQMSTYWWDLAAKKVLHTEAGSGHLSQNGKSIGFYDPSDWFNPTDGPARFFRTDRKGKITKLDSVKSCALSPNGDKIVCSIPQRKPHDFFRRVFSVDDGELLDEISLNGLWVYGRLSPDGDADLEGNSPAYLSFWTAGASRLVGGDSSFALGFSYGGRLIMVDGDYLRLEEY